MVKSYNLTTYEDISRLQIILNLFLHLLHLEGLDEERQTTT